MSVDQLCATYELQTKITHYPLHPDTPEDGLTLEQLFAGRNLDVEASKAHMVELMADVGLPYGDRTMTYNSRLAQELAKWAETQPGNVSLDMALFEAYFVENRNLAKVDVLVDIVEKLGLDSQQASKALEQREFKQAVDNDWQRCKELGVSGVPTFLLGSQVVVGAQPFENLERLALANGVKRR